MPGRQLGETGSWLRPPVNSSRITTFTMMVNPLKLFRLTFEMIAMAMYHAPRWFVSGIRIWLCEDRKGNWTLGRHLRIQMKRHIPGIRRR